MKWESYRFHSHINLPSNFSFMNALAIFTQLFYLWTLVSWFVRGAVNVLKEADFEMYLPYSELVESYIDDKVIVQGVVDLIVEREDSIDIVDYKFSSLKIDSLKVKYAEQLSLYKKAVEYAFNKPVNTFIYSINSGELK